MALCNSIHYQQAFTSASRRNCYDTQSPPGGEASRLSEYSVPIAAAEAEVTIRRSRFVARAEPIAVRADAMAALARAREAHPKARHHCWAYLVGEPMAAQDAGSSDDGEPGGTAGQPIITAIQRQGIGDIVVIVSRYFGGVKLGTGGLARAYTRASGAALEALSLRRRLPCCQVELQLGFALEHAVRDWLAHHDGAVEAVSYGSGVTMHLTVPEQSADALSAFCGAQGIACRVIC
jgi:uncharacterized YigZ family protein